VVFGCAGSGKSTLARKLSERTGLLLVERDTLAPLGSEAYLQTIAELVRKPRWILDGAPYYADSLVYPLVDTVLVLDYAKPVVMGRKDLPPGIGIQRPSPGRGGPSPQNNSLRK